MVAPDIRVESNETYKAYFAREKEATGRAEAILPKGVEIHDDPGGGTYIKFPLRMAADYMQSVIDAVYPILREFTEEDGLAGYVVNFEEDMIYPSSYENVRTDESQIKDGLNEVLEQVASHMLQEAAADLTGDDNPDTPKSLAGAVLGIPGVRLRVAEHVFGSVLDVMDGTPEAFGEIGMLSDEQQAAIRELVANQAEWGGIRRN